jgi:arylsulfatase A-like enzyme
LIVLDTLRADKVGSYGGPDGISPELDALANEGVRFANVVAPSNWTKPSWAGMLTARYPRSVGVYKEIGECLPDDVVTLAESFQAGGYRTYGATANPNINSTFNYQQGFEEYLNSHVIWDWMEITTDAAAASKQNSNEARLAPATELYKNAVAWAAEQDGAPCYIQICTMEMHEYLRGDFSLNRPEFQDEFSSLTSPEREYYQALKQSSFDLDQFLRDLRAVPGWDDVLVIVTSDHGEGLSDHPDVARSEHHGGVMYDSNLHVPLIAHRPDALPRGHVVDEAVRLLDLAPTILAMAGLPAMEKVDGVSLMPLVDGATSVEGLPDAFVTESYIRGLDKIAIESPTWRYIENRDQKQLNNVQRGQMNLEALQKIGATQNGTATDQIATNPEVAAALREQLRAWEAAHPEALPTECGMTVTDEEFEQLRAIGYLGEDDQL